MLIICNGIPKSGTHALIKCVELLGVPWVQGGSEGDHCIHGHWPISDPPPEGKHLMMVRHPRNILVSWVRFQRTTVTDGYLIAAMKHFERGPLTSEIANYALWQMQDVLTVRYEELISDSGKTVAKIAGFISVPYLLDAYKNLPGLTKTWTGVPSDWREHWTPSVDAAWHELGGPAAEKAFGYG